MLYAFGLSWGDSYAFAMIPSFTNVTADPELIGIVVSATAAALCVTMFIFFILGALICCWLLDAFHLPIA
ncbi:hypothetical protein HanPI659440_Chr10g0372471 [Helianthus annuus]|nr:hypothetical protein HanPI659440_Chr10g0372471 [Helianthus annuus]